MIPARMRRFGTKDAQRGIALVVIVTLIALIAAYLLVARLRASSELTADRRGRNAEALNRAKQVLIGYVARQAAVAGEANPGRLPCPEHPAYIGDPAREGTAAPGVAVPSPACAIVGRFPWRTLGVDKLVDAWNEPLWYVVSPGIWSLQTSSTLLTINSNTPGSLTVDGSANAAVALIIAPGPAMNVQAAAGCTARAQARTATPPDPLDYLECFNTATSTFATTGPSASFNDQVVRITVADVMPEIEAAIAERIRREIVPVLKSVYGSAPWGLTAANPLFPFAAPFANPGPTGSGLSNYQGEYAPSDPSKCPNVAARCQGLLPLTYTAASCGGDPRCTTGFVSWNTSVTPTITATNGVILDASCGFSSGNPRCDGHYAGLQGQTVQLNMTARASNVAMTLKTLDTSGAATSLRYGLSGLGSPIPGTGAAGTFNADGSANVTSTAGGPGADLFLPLGVAVQFRITTSIGVLPDHAFLNATSDPTYGWFWRNEWYRLLYYAPALGNTATGVPTPSCTSGVSCLSVANVAPAGKQRAILILAGRNINTSPSSTRPSGNLGDYLEFGNADGNTSFEQQPISTVVNPALKAPFNDRVIVLDSNP